MYKRKGLPILHTPIPELEAVIFERRHRTLAPSLSPRIRFRTSFVSPKSVSWNDTKSWDGAGNQSSSNTQVRSGVNFDYVNTFSGVSNPFWKDEIRQGRNAGTAASGGRTTYEIGFFSAFMEAYDASIPPNRYQSEWYGHPFVDLPSGPAPQSSTVTSVTNRAISRFLDHADNARSSVESGQDFGEVRESLTSLVNPLSSLRRHVLSYFPSLKKVRAKYRKPIDLKKALADTYLEWTFGWKPLSSDIAQAYVGLQNRNRQFQLVPIHGSAKERFSGSQSSVLNAVDSQSLLEQRTNTRSYSEYSVKFRGVVKTGAVNGSISAGQVLQLDLPHFLPTAWDLLPYSFIVDYFTNVGDVIRAYSMRKSDISWCMKTVRTVRHSDFSHTIHDAGNNWKLRGLYSPGDCNSMVETVSFQRSPTDPQTLLPSLMFEIPHGKPWVNIGALILSRIKPLVPFFRT